MSTEFREYNTPQNRRIYLSIAGFIFLFVFNLLTIALFNHGVSLPACLGMTLALYVSSGQKVKLTNDRLIVKAILGKAKEFLYADGTFSLEEATGLKALFLTFSSKASILYFTPKQGGKKQLVTFMLAKNDIQSIYQQMQAAGYAS